MGSVELGQRLPRSGVREFAHNTRSHWSPERESNSRPFHDELLSGDIGWCCLVTPRRRVSESGDLGNARAEQVIDNGVGTFPHAQPGHLRRRSVHERQLPGVGVLRHDGIAVNAGEVPDGTTGSDRTAASRRSGEPMLSKCGELERCARMVSTELGEVGHDLITAHARCQVLQHVVRRDQRADEARLPAAHVPTHIDQRQQIHDRDCRSELWMRGSTRPIVGPILHAGHTTFWTTQCPPRVAKSRPVLSFS